jgi:type I restriction enzyme S subunit
VSWYANTVGRDYFVRHGRQTTNLASINRTLLSRLPVPVPSQQEQRAILNEIDRRESVAQVLEREMAAAEHRATTLGAEILRLSLDEAAGPPLWRR